MEKELPFVAFSNNELDKFNVLGDEAICPNCNENHQVRYGERVLDDGTKVPSKQLAFITCEKNDTTYLVGVNGKQINFRKENKNDTLVTE